MSSVCLASENMAVQLYKGHYSADVDSRELALYTPEDASCYLGIHPKTLATWLWGRTYPVAYGEGYFEPLIEPADPDNRLLSFFNLAELHVLAATRFTHKVPLNAVRAAVSSIQKGITHAHPLISKDFLTNGSDLFVKTVAETENLSRPGQLNFKGIMDTFIKHVVADEHDLIKKIFPLIAGQPDDRIISITYGISSSQPAIEDSGVPAWLIHSRHAAGEPVDSIAEDFDLPTSKIQRAIEFFEQRPA